MSDEVLDFNLFMMCESLNLAALSDLPAGYHVRNCRPDELELWKAMPFDTPEDAAAHRGYMTAFFERVYAPQAELFYQKCLFVCNADDQPLATCFLWKAHGSLHTLHWLKVLKSEEGKGLGRALLSYLLKPLQPADYPLYLHTQPGSFRALKLYADFGFELLDSEGPIGGRDNQLRASLPYLKSVMPPEAFASLKIRPAPAALLALDPAVPAEF